MGDSSVAVAPILPRLPPTPIGERIENACQGLHHGDPVRRAAQALGAGAAQPEGDRGR
jgi:hypothetical protein